VRLGVMCSGNGTNFENIVKQCPDHEVVLMIHNKEECGAKRKAYDLGIPACHIKSKDEHLISITFQALEVDLIVMAGWMRIVGKELIDSFNDRIINIHPSLLPKYKGLNAVQQALDSKDKTTGCTVHLVTEELDSGKILHQASVPIEEDDTLDTLSDRIHKEEYRILPLVINNWRRKC
tara:strand:+ start:1254 stop:1787 length:534 start_codon:yes stop_codon:yes gene_type:complete